MLEEHDHKHAVHDFDGIIENRVSAPPVYFTVLFYGLIIWAVIFTAFYLFSGWSSEKEFNARMSSYQQQEAAVETADSMAPAGKAPQGQQAAAVAVGEAGGEPDAGALYARHCTMCHGDDAQGGIGPDLTAAEYVHGNSRDEIITSIASGRPNGMPAFDKQLSRADMAALADYLLALQAPATGQQADEPAAGEPAAEQPDAAAAPAEETARQVDAAGLYAQRCAMCHGADGTGGIGSDLTAAEYSYGKDPQKVAESITNGRPKGMPAFGGQLSAEEINALAEYVGVL